MLALSLRTPDPGDPLRAATIAEVPGPEPRAGWTTVSIRSAALNHHDLRSMRGLGVDPSWPPCVLITFVDSHGIAPPIDSRHDLSGALDGARRMLDGDVFGKLIVTP